MKPVREQLAPAAAAEIVACERISGDDFGCLWHFHPELELTLVLSGGSFRWIGDKISPLEKGDLTFLGPNLPHDFRNDPVAGRPVTKVTAVTVQFHPRFLGENWLGNAGMAPIQRLFQRSLTGLQITGKTRGTVARLMLRMLPADGVRRLILLLEILELLANSRELATISSPGFAPEIHPSDSERMEAISRYIRKNLDRPLYLSDVARHAGMTDVTFSRYFRSRTGKTFPNYINEFRIARVCRLLAETEDTVSGIAWNCGFDSIANFQKQFVRIHGCTPKVYRKRALHHC
ncbi:AraC family transcriptional regulator [Luteolibacter sp. Populi]|uniref:AraC family transcriptional regulator n=1 Tax=Luteolibacter sp. Populi TaxID=3230487 RepID=UPI003467D35B